MSPLQKSRLILHPARRAGGRRGFTGMMMALLLIPLFAALGISLDLGRCLIISDRLQAAVDAAALSGAEALSSGNVDPGVTSTVQATYKSNILTGGLMGATASSTATVTYGTMPNISTASCVHVVATANVPSLIIQMIGSTGFTRTALTVEAVAIAPMNVGGIDPSNNAVFSVGNAVLVSASSPQCLPLHGCAYSTVGSAIISGCSLIASGTSWTPPSNVTTLKVLAVGGGGGGAGYTGQASGGSGYVASSLSIAASGAPFTVTAGSGGAGGTGGGYGGAGGAGTASSFGALTANGGTPGLGGGNGSAGSGGSAGGPSDYGCSTPGYSGGTNGSGAVSPGCTGGYTLGTGQGASFASDLVGFTTVTLTAGSGGAGGASPSNNGAGGGGGVLVNNTGSSGNSASIPGGIGGAGYGGGGGACDSIDSTCSGGAGGNGLVYIEW